MKKFYWLIGGLVSSVICFLLSLPLIAYNLGAQFKVGGILSVLSVISIAPGFIIFNIFTEIIPSLLPCSFGNFGLEHTGCPGSTFVMIFILSINFLFYFLIGSLIGWIIGKVSKSANFNN